ncbi:MAG: energy transducer TonB [Terracidiphilus sp.]
MRKIALLTLELIAFASLCHAEPRWCTATGRDPTNTLVYPPIAKAARVQGTVLAHLIYSPAGQIEDVQPLFGPAMLSQAVRSQLMKWTVKTDASGDAPCQTLVIIDFQLEDPDHPVEQIPPTPPPGVLRISVTGELLIISDPAGQISWRDRFTYKLRRALKRIIGK